MRKFDLIDALAIAFIIIGMGIFATALILDPPSSLNELFLTHFGDWTPGFVLDGILLLIINSVIHMHERRRIINQAGSLSNEFALDAVRRCREEGWLQNGVMRNKRFLNARLDGADLSESNLSGTILSFANLAGADLTHSDLTSVDLRGANLRGADLRWANLSDACLNWADLRDANLTGAVLDDIRADFSLVDKAQSTVHAFKNAVVDGFISDRQTRIVESTFKQFLDVGDAASIRFYERLFERAPHVQDLFHGDIDIQARMFLQSLNVIVVSLSSTDRAARVLQRLGEKHRGYGVMADHYTVMGTTLVETIGEFLGDDFDKEAAEAWTAAFRLISSIMISASEQK